MIGLHIIICRVGVDRERRYRKIMRDSFCPFSTPIQSHLYAVSYTKVSHLWTLHIILLLVFIIKIAVYIGQG